MKRVFLTFYSGKNVCARVWADVTFREYAGLCRLRDAVCECMVGQVPFVVRDEPEPGFEASYTPEAQDNQYHWAHISAQEGD